MEAGRMAAGIINLEAVVEEKDTESLIRVKIVIRKRRRGWQMKQPQ